MRADVAFDFVDDSGEPAWWICAAAWRSPSQALRRPFGWAGLVKMHCKFGIQSNLDCFLLSPDGPFATLLLGRANERVRSNGQVHLNWHIGD